MQGLEQSELVQIVNDLRYKSLEGKGDGPEGMLSDEQVKRGISALARLRVIRAGGKKSINEELPPILHEKLEDLF